MSQHANHRLRTVPARQMPPDQRARQEARAVEDARLLEADGGWPPDQALRRARQARGLVSTPAAALHPSLVTAPRALSPEWRRAARDHFGGARPNLAGGTQRERLNANRRVDLVDLKPRGRPRGSGTGRAR